MAGRRHRAAENRRARGRDDGRREAGLPHSEVPFPIDYPAPYKEHRVACGVALYQAMGVARDDKAGALRRVAPQLRVLRRAARRDRRVRSPARTVRYVDVGVWLGYVLTAAAALGVDTCPMASVAAYPDALRANLPIAETDVILFGSRWATPTRPPPQTDPHDPRAGRGERHVLS